MELVRERHHKYIGMERDRTAAHHTEETELSPATKDLEAAPHIWCIGTCVMERILRERVMIINGPNGIILEWG